MNKLYVPAPPPCEAPKKSAGRPKASDIEARNQNLVACAGQLFLRHGYSNVSLEAIAREAHVAVRTIYVKFGGKAGLLKAAIDANRERFYNVHDLMNDERPLRESLTEFALHFYDMVTTPQAAALKRMVIAEAGKDRELIETFMASAPDMTAAMLLNFLSRPANRAQLRDDLPLAQLPNFLLNCVIGDQFTHLLFDQQDARPQELRRALPNRLELFFHAVLREPAV